MKIPKTTIVTVTKPTGQVEYQVVQGDTLVATVTTLYDAQQLMMRIAVNPINPL